MGLLTFADGIIKLDNVEVVGLLVSQRVKTSLRFDTQQLDGMSGKVKKPIGWNDADITLVLELLTDDVDTCYEKLVKLNKLFRTKTDDGAKIFDINNKHLLARGVRQVIFNDLESNETNNDDVISVTIAFTEYEQPITKIEEGSNIAKSQENIKANKAENINEPKPDKAIFIDVK